MQPICLCCHWSNRECTQCMESAVLHGADSLYTAVQEKVELIGVLLLEAVADSSAVTTRQPFIPQLPAPVPYSTFLLCMSLCHMAGTCLRHVVHEGHSKAVQFLLQHDLGVTATDDGVCSAAKVSLSHLLKWRALQCHDSSLNRFCRLHTSSCCRSHNSYCCMSAIAYHEI